MDFTIYNRRSVSKSEFLRFWSAVYRYNDEQAYDDNIGKELTSDRIQALFHWKNGMSLSGDKLSSIEKNFIQRREELKKFRKGFSAAAFLDHFDKGGPTWRIFWLHCFSPGRFPIFDQHVNRAMTYLQTGKAEEISGAKRVKQYVAKYLPFYVGFADHDRRRVDKALWAFGKFLKNWQLPDQSTHA